MENLKENLNIKETAKYLNCSVSMIRKLIYNNEISYYKIRQSLLFQPFHAFYMDYRQI